ncbi:MAG: polysaccharide deacetylase family protein [Chloroflexi bacterium]|nr:polysaccharide deacetylase family protein [Chloroflexota bacterium]
MTTQAITPINMSRRQFLKSLGALCGNFAVMGLPTVSFGLMNKPTHVAVPPSLMLHSVHANPQFLPPLLTLLQEYGFTGTTYKEWYRCILQDVPIANPLIISIDDISMADQGCPSFDKFAQMKEWIQAAGMTAVYGVITEPNGQPDREQDEARWDLMQSWVEDGFELATHTSYHSVFNAKDTTARSDFTAVDYEAEIVRSATLIEQKLGERGVPYNVQTLILPFGSGYSYMQPEPQIHSGIVAACQQTNVRFVAGIPQGQEPLSIADLTTPEKIMYVGRIGPIVVEDEGEPPRSDAWWTFAWLKSWREKNVGRVAGVGGIRPLL